MWQAEGNKPGLLTGTLPLCLRSTCCMGSNNTGYYCLGIRGVSQYYMNIINLLLTYKREQKNEKKKPVSPKRTNLQDRKRKRKGADFRTVELVYRISGHALHTNGIRIRRIQLPNKHFLSRRLSRKIERRKRRNVYTRQP